MLLTPTTQTAARVAAQLELQISDRLDDQTRPLFDAYANLMDSLAGGTSGEPLLVSYDDLVAEDLAAARALLA